MSIEEGGDGDDGEEDFYSEAENKIHREDFGLPDEDYAELKWRQRFVSARDQKDESPPLLPELNLASVPPVRFTPSFSVEPSETATAPGNRRTGQRGGTARRGRGRIRMRASNTRQPARQVEEKQQEHGAESEDEEDPEESEDNEEKGESEESGAPTRSTRAVDRAKGRTSSRTTATRLRIRGRRR